MKNTEQVKNALDLLREAEAGASAPEFLETRLRAAFREQHAPVQPKVAPWWAAWRTWASVAMAGLVVGAVVYRVAVPDRVEAPTPQPAPVAVTKPVPVTPSPVRDAEAVVAHAPKPKVARPAAPTVRRSQPIEATTASARESEEFMAIPYAPPMMAQDRGEVVRVRLPRQSLRQLGIPVNPERLFERVPADILVGEDGIPRGIRFVRTTESR